MISMQVYMQNDKGTVCCNTRILWHAGNRY